MTSQTGAAFLTTDEAAERIGIPPGALRYWRRAGVPPQGPPHIKIGKAVMYPVEDVNQYIADLRAQALASA
jgi:Helix-turn-helix domain